jgi:hypothetical protein
VAFTFHKVNAFPLNRALTLDAMRPLTIEMRT